MSTNTLFHEKTLQTMQVIRKIFLKVAIWILIGELVAGAMVILTDSQDIFVGKVMGTFMIFAVMLFVSVINCARIEKGSKVIQGFATAGLISNLLWAALAILLLWEAVPFQWVEEVLEGGRYAYTRYSYHTTGYGILMQVLMATTVICLWVTSVLAIKETLKMIKPLKVTSMVCAIYLWFYALVVIIAREEPGMDLEKLSLLAGLAFLAGIATWIIAKVISKSNEKKLGEAKETEARKTAGVQEAHKTEKSHVAAVSVRKTDAELRAEIEAQVRAEIEEKVRREKIEKEVRERIEKEVRAEIEKEAREEIEERGAREDIEETVTEVTIEEE